MNYLVLPVPINVEIEVIFPRLVPCRSGLNLAQVDIPLGKFPEKVI